MAGNKAVTYRFDEDLLDRLEERADAYGRSKTSAVEEGIRMWLDVYPQPKKKARPKKQPKRP
jgi:predicted transcriptional regulator